MVKVKQTGVNSWKVGTAVIVRDTRAFHVAGCLPGMSAFVDTLVDAVAIARQYDTETKAATK